MFLLPTYNPILIAAAVIPAVILLGYIYKKDRLEKEPSQLLISLVFMGVISTTLAAMAERAGGFLLDTALEETSLLYRALMYFAVVAFAEEGAKYILLKSKTWQHPAFNCQFDGVVYAVFVSLGFALWENIGYVAAYGLSTALIRAVTAVPGHACFGVFMGAWYGIAKRYANQGEGAKATKFRRLALIVPALTHGTYDFIATMTSPAASLIFIAFVAVVFFTAFLQVRKLSNKDQFIDGGSTVFF